MMTNVLQINTKQNRDKFTNKNPEFGLNVCQFAMILPAVLILL